jgi:hypothetical protein
MSGKLLTRRILLQGAAAMTLAAPFGHGAHAAARLTLNLPNIMFDSMGAQVQVQNQTGDRLTTWTNALSAQYAVNYTDWEQAIAPQLEGNGGTSRQDVFIITTHQYTSVPKDSTPPPISPNPTVDKGNVIVIGHSASPEMRAPTGRRPARSKLPTTSGS